jgi:hypothetical protein
MLNKIILAAAMLLSLVAAPAFSDDETVDCFYEANANHPACTKAADTQLSLVTEQVFSDSELCQ